MSAGDVRGLQETLRKLATAAAQIEQAADEGAGESAEAAADDMRARVPVLTGDTRRHIGVRPGSKPGTRQAGVFDSEAIAFIEFGTSDTPAQPTVLPAAESERQKIEGRVGGKIKGAVG